MPPKKRTKKTTENVESCPIEERFYTEEHKMTPDRKRRLIELVKRPEFRDFEEYLDWRINSAAHRMKAFLKERRDNEAANEAAEIDALVKITQDMRNFWNEVKFMDVEDEILLKKKKEKKATVFGDNSYSLDPSPDAPEIV